MIPRILPISVLLVGAVCVSCVPYPEPGARGGRRSGPHEQAPLTPEQQEAQRKADELKKKEEAEKAKREKELAGGDGPTNPGENKQEGSPKPPPTKNEKKDWPYAMAVPERKGFVFSPYNNKMVDVRDIPSGTLVQDPTYPASEMKRFRVP